MSALAPKDPLRRMPALAVGLVGLVLALGCSRPTGEKWAARRLGGDAESLRDEARAKSGGEVASRPP